jgi:hypothetical protein
MAVFAKFILGKLVLEDTKRGWEEVKGEER